MEVATSAVALALVDQAGSVHAAEPDFRILILAEWPADAGTAALPKPLLECLKAGQPYIGKELSVEFREAGKHFFVTARRLRSLDRLAPRERRVALAYAHGETYKEIARALGVSPETVRKQIQMVYRKLGVNDKAGLATLIAKLSR